jgi:hypothetical protein
MRSVLIDHARRYPEWQVEDLYKLLLQASRGAEHATLDRESAQLHMERELASLGEGPGEPLVDPITPSGMIVRVHLRPFASLNLNPELLVNAFMGTMNNLSHSRDGYSGFAEVAAGLCRDGLLPFIEPKVTSYLEGMQAAGLPAVHHSNIFVENYRPAYRVIERQFLPQEWLSED